MLSLALLLEVHGEEYVRYNEMYGDLVVSRTHRNQLLADQVKLSTDNPCDSALLFAVGEYRFPFSYLLGPTLPGAFHVDERHARDTFDIDAAVKYELKLRVPVKGALTPDLRAKQLLAVTDTRIAQLIRPRTEATAQPAKRWGVLRQGFCEVSGSLDQDVHVAGDTLHLRVSVANGANMDVKSVSVQLMETLLIREAKGCDAIRAHTCLVKKTFPGVKAGATVTDRPHSLDLVGKSKRYAVCPPVASSFVETSHHVEVHCNFSMSPSVHVEIPVKIVASRAGEVATVAPELVTVCTTKAL